MSIELGQFEFEDLSAYLDGELPPERAERVRRLVARDPGWRQAKRDLESLDAAMDLWADTPTPEDLPARIARNVRRTARRTPQVIRLVRLAAPLAAAAAVLVAVIGTFRTPPAPRTGGDRTNTVVTNGDGDRTNIVRAGFINNVVADLDWVRQFTQNWGRSIQAYYGSVLEKHFSRGLRKLGDQDRRIADKTIEDNIEILGLFRDYEIAENFETLEAIGRLENGT